ncbi:MAG: hypothetical protein ACOX6H_01945 [Christensenellales bacterium]|jgi:predicted small lipoprotein YifL
MKKITYLLFAFLLIATSTLLAACGKKEPDEFWTKTYTAATEFKQKEESQFVFDREASLTYSEQIQAAITQDPLYAELTINYEPLLKSSVEMFNMLSENLALQPANTKGKIKNYFTEFDEDIKSFDNSISTFLAKKTTFENSVANIDLTSDHAYLQLRTFKSAYREFLRAAESFNNSFENLFLNTYLALPTQALEQANPLLPKLYTTVVISQLTKAQINYLFDNTDTINKKLSTSMDLAIEILRIELKNPADLGENLTTNVNYFRPIYDAFINELSQFYNALKNVNLFEYSNQEDKETYAEEKNIVAFVEKINSFVEETAAYISVSLTTHLI